MHATTDETTEEQSAVDPPAVVHTGSISSAVDLDFVHNEAHKVYHPSLPVRLLYWLAFQAPFPYVANHHALEAARLRRVIVDLLTKVWFGHHLVARVLDVADLPGGGHDFVTRLVRGAEPTDRRRAKYFLKQLDEHFIEAGLPTWQTTPYNPHAITNFIEARDGSYRIIDLESSLVSFLYPLSRIVGLVRLGQFPSFDDIDTARLQDYVRRKSAVIDAALPPGEREVLDRSMAAYARQQALWHKSERRYLPRALRFALRLVDVPAWVRWISGLTARSHEGAESFVRSGIDRWEAEGRLTPEEAAAAKARLSAPAVTNAMLHLSAHFAVSLPLRFPFGALARFIYTVVLRARAEIAGLLARRPPKEARQTHTLLVALFALLPGVGRLAYLLAPPLRANKLLLVVPFDGLAQKLPGQAYQRLHAQALFDWWARTTPAARALAPPEPQPALLERAKAVAPQVPALALIAAVNIAVFGLGAFLYERSNGASTWWFEPRGVAQTFGALQLAAAGVAGVTAFRLYWRARSRSPADAAGIFLWGLLGVGLIFVAFDDYFDIHEAVGDAIADRFTDGVNLSNGLVALAYVCAGVALLYVFRHELRAHRASSAVLSVALILSLGILVADVAGNVGWPRPFELSDRALVSGLLLAASYLRLREVIAVAAPSADAVAVAAPARVSPIPAAWTAGLRRYRAALPAALRSERPATLAILAYALLAAGLTAISVGAATYDRFPGDVALTRAVQDIDSRVLTDLMRASTSLTSPLNSVTALAIAVTLLLLAARPRLALFAAGALGSHLIGAVLKVIVDRHRPDDDTITRVRIEEEYSYPSGHVEWAVAFEGFLVFAVWQLTGNRWIRGATLVAWAAHVLLTSAGRIDQGLHWPSDVVGALALVLLVWLYRVSGHLAEPDGGAGAPTDSL